MNCPQIAHNSRFLLVVLIGCWIVSRCFYFFYLGVRFDSEPLGTYLQYIDPVLLKTALWQSTFYLNDQPPGFNLFLGVILKLFGSYVDWAFQAAYYGFGLGLTIVLFVLLLRLGVFPVLAFLVTTLFCLSPVTLLYENWLFYSYPLTFLLALSALFLHRYLSSERTVDAAMFFSTMAVIILSRGIFHWAWLLLVLWALLLLRPRSRGQLVLAAVLPCVFVVAFYCKNYLVFENTISGDVYRKANFGMMVFNNLSDHAMQELIATGKVTGLADVSPYRWLEEPQYRRLLPPIKRWGIPVLDQEVKSSGAANWNSQIIANFAEVYYRDAKVAARQYPTAYPFAVIKNLDHYFRSADQTWPFPNANSINMGKLLSVWHVLFDGELPFLGSVLGRVAWLNLIAFPMCFLFGCRSVGLWPGRSGMWERSTSANDVVILFMLYNIAYVAAVTILFSVGDTCRYRFQVSPFYAALFSLLIASWVKNWTIRSPS